VMLFARCWIVSRVSQRNSWNKTNYNPKYQKAIKRTCEDPQQRSARIS